MSKPEELKKKKKKKHDKKKEKSSKEQPIRASKPNSNLSPFVQVTTALYLPLSPNAYHFPLSGLVAEHISPNLMTYYPPLHGVLLAFQNPRISEHPTDRPQASENDVVDGVLTRSIDENAVTYVWLTAEFLVFRPRRGTTLEGQVSVSNEGLLGLVCYNYFNAAIERSRLPADWTWVDGQWKDADGNDIPTKLQFMVEDLEVSGTESLNIKGTLLGQDG